mmetsp:Transcript_96568/g.191403  ORF Transcript_96568/g.191403 Transcript_96568/m.191403 type:complete len:206 (-) Transcript_96568:30-647(-)
MGRTPMTPSTPADSEWEEELTPSDEVSKSSFTIFVLGAFMAASTVAVAILYIVSALHVPSSCNTRLRAALFELAGCTGAIGVLSFAGSFSTWKEFGALQSFLEEATGGGPLDVTWDTGEMGSVTENKNKLKFYRGVVRSIVFIQSIFSLLYLPSQAFATFPAYKALHNEDPQKCGQWPAIIFWPLGLINFVLVIIDALIYKCMDV